MRSNRSEDLFLEITMILEKMREIQDQSLFLENTNFWESLPRAPNFEYPSLFPTLFQFGQILNQAKVGGPQKACHAESRCNFLIFVSKIRCSLKKRWTKTLSLSFCQNTKISQHTSIPFTAHQCVAAHSLGNPGIDDNLYYGCNCLKKGKFN